MPKYMFSGSYSLQGLEGVFKEGGSGRLKATKQVVEAAGGAVESYYFAFGGDDFILIADLPDNVSAAALSLVAAASGAINSRVTVLLTPEEVDAATKVSVDYRPPGE